MILDFAFLTFVYQNCLWSYGYCNVGDPVLSVLSSCLIKHKSRLQGIIVETLKISSPTE